jgi:putative endonuclease
MTGGNNPSNIKQIASSYLLAMTVKPNRFMQNKSYIYIMTNRNNSVLYTGVTSDLKTRVYEHKTRKHKDSFTSRYNIDKLVYFEILSDMNTAISREKQIKSGSRKKKLDLINEFNPDWHDLFGELG